MNHEIEKLTQQATDLIPKGGVWITLKNIQLGLEILFDTIRQLLSLALVLALLWYVYQITPSIDGIKTILGTSS
jgi:hypothetical protein